MLGPWRRFSAWEVRPGDRQALSLFQCAKYASRQNLEQKSVNVFLVSNFGQLPPMREK